jgi:hypothetical protein
MDKIRNKYSILIGIIIIILSLIFTIRYININHKYPPPVYKKHNLNEPVKYESLEVKATDFKIMNANEIQELGSVYEEITTPDDKNIKCIVAKILIKNSSARKMNLEVYPFTLESLGYSNGIDQGLFNVLNGKDSTMVPDLEPNEELILLLPFTIIEKQFTKPDWDNIVKRKFQLVLSLYPEKKFIVLN